MPRILLGSLLVLGLFVACGSDDDKRKTRAEGGEAGEGGAGGAGAPATGGTDAGAGASGGAGGEPALGGAAGAQNASSGAGGSAGEAGEAGGTSEAGAAGAGSGLVSACGEGMYDTGEGGCAVCEGTGGTVLIDCNDYFDALLVADDGVLAIRLTPLASVREPFPSTASVSYVTPDQTQTLPVVFDPLSAAWHIDISSGPDAPAEVIVQPFMATGACGDSYFSTEPVTFIAQGPDNYLLSCGDI